jgi:malate dehydrogenase (oxaloacetate-decarboxylating)
VRASDINDRMKIAAAYALADCVPAQELSADCIIPSALDPRVVQEVAKAVAQAARDCGVARI